ncbi:unnamed protein product [Brassica oleracea var. botrytis]
MMPRNTFHPLQYRQLINIATASNYLPGKQLLILKHFLKKYNSPKNINIMPDVVGQVVLIQGTDLQNPSVISKIVVALLLNRSKMVRLTLMDNASSLFRDLHSKTVMKYKVVLITSINPRVLKAFLPYMITGKLTLATTTATRFYCDSSINLIQSFIRTNEVSNHS